MAINLFFTSVCVRISVYNYQKYALLGLYKYFGAYNVVQLTKII